MKIFISQPMKGLSKEQILQNRQEVVDKLTSYGHTIVDSYIEDRPPNCGNEALYCLGKSLQIIAEEADAVYFMDGWSDARGCYMEHDACFRYGIKILYDE